MSNEDRRTIENLAMIQQLITEGRVDLALDEIRFQLDLLKASGLLADSAYEEAIKKGRDEAIALITIPEGISEGELSVEQEA